MKKKILSTQKLDYSLRSKQKTKSPSIKKKEETRKSSYRDKRIEDTALLEKKKKTDDSKSKKALGISTRSKSKKKETVSRKEVLQPQLHVRSRRGRNERQASEDEDEEIIGKDIKKKSAKIEKMNTSRKKTKLTGENEQEEGDDFEEKEVKPKISSKNSKKKKIDVDEEEEEDEPQSNKKRPKSVPLKKKSKKKKEKEEQSSDEDDEEEPSRSKSKKKGSKRSKTSKTSVKYIKGKQNPLVDILSSNKYMESKEPQLYDECCVQCSNRNVFRAVQIGSLALLKKCIVATESISSIVDIWSPEMPYTPLDIAILRGDKQMITEILQFFSKDNKFINRCGKPNHKLSYIETGESNQFMFGVKTRHLNMTRGNRMGNNAFLQDEDDSDWINKAKVTILTKVKDPRMIDYVLTASLNPMNSLSQTVSFDFEQNIVLAVRSGNYTIARELLQKVSKGLSNYGFNYLHSLVLTTTTDKFVVPVKTSLNKKSVGNMAITPVHVACINPNEKILKHLIDLGADWHFPDMNNRKPLHYAAGCEGPGPLKLLLEMGSHPDECDKSKCSPLMIACEWRREENVKELIKAKANCLLKCRPECHTALHFAAMNGHSEICRILVEDAEVNVDLPGKDRMTPLMMAAAVGHVETVETLLELGAKVIKKDKFKRSALIHASKSGQSVIASILLARGSEFNYPDSSSNSPLHYACAYGWIEIVDLLIKAGANVDAVNMWKISAMEVAMLKNHFNIVMFLLNNSNVNVNMKFDKGNTLLHHSFVQITPKTVREIEYLIVEKKADVNIQNMEGKSPLHLLAEFNYQKFIQANPLTDEYSKKNYQFYNRNEFDEDVLKIKKIQTEKHQAMIKTLFEKLVSNGALINLKTNLMKSPLQIALETANLPFIQEIVEKSPDLLFIDTSNRTILHLLCDYLFNEESQDILRSFMIKISQLPDCSMIINSIDDDGFTPILKLFFKYSQDVKGYYDHIVKRETYRIKKMIFEKHANNEDESAKRDEISEMIDVESDDEEEMKEFPRKKVPKKVIKGLFRKGLLTQITESGKWSNTVNKSQQIETIHLSNDEISDIQATSRGILFSYLNSVFTELFSFFLHLGCNVHIQINKLKKWRGLKPSEVPKSNDTKNDNDIPNGFAPTKAATSSLMHHKVSRKCRPMKQTNAITQNKKPKIKACDAYYKDIGLSNCLMLIMKLPLIDILKNLIENFKVDVNIVDIYGKSALLHLIQQYSDIEYLNPGVFPHALEILLQSKVHVNKCDKEGNSAFFLLSKIWQINEMDRLFQNGADVNQMNKNGENALIYYTRRKEKAKVELLLRKFSMDTNYCDDKKRTVLHYLYNDEESTADIDVSLKQMILSNGPNINARDICGRTPLHYLFVKIGKEFETTPIDPIVALSTLLEVKGIELDAEDIYGNTALHYASQRGATISVMTMINHKVNVNKKNNEGNTPLAYALIFKQPSYAILLVQQGANIYDNSYMLVNRSEEELVKEMKKKKKQSSEIFEEDQKKIEDISMGQDEEMRTEEENPENDKELNIEDEYDDDDYTDDDYDYNDPIYKKPQQINFAFGQSCPAKQSRSSCFSNNIPPLNFKGINAQYFVEQDDKNCGVSLFRICVKNDYQGLTYLFVSNGYDLMTAIQDSFYEQRFNLAMLLLDKSPYDSIYRNVNERGQNLFHILANFGKGVQNKADLIQFFDKLYEKKIPIEAQDTYGNTPLHYACENQFQELCEFLLSKGDAPRHLSITNKIGHSPFISFIKGKNISSAMDYILELLKYIDKSQISMMFKDESYMPGYQLTPLIHATRRYLTNSEEFEAITTVEGKIIIKFIEKGANVMEQDSIGMDCLMHCVKENNFRLLDLLISNCKKQLIFNSCDKNGRSLIHYAVCPIEEGSYENEQLLGYLLEKGFDVTIKDKFGMTPVDYAIAQSSGKNLNILKKFKVAAPDTNCLRRQLSGIFNWPESFSYEKDAETLYKSKEADITKRELVKMIPDPNGNFNPETHELVKDEVLGYWDLTMTKVKVGNGLYGEYMFYKMQIIHDKGRDIYILWTRFGRIGDTGQFQRTPFNELSQAEDEFKKIFRSKSGNEWSEKDSFVKQKGKYMLLHFNESKLSHKDLLEPIDYKRVRESHIKEKEIRDLLRDITNSAIYFKALQESGIDTELLNFNFLNKDLILRARGILGEINTILQEIAAISQTGKDSLNNYTQETIDKVMIMKSEIYDLSSRYYELIPKSQFKNTAVQPLDRYEQIKQEIMMLENLTYVENAVKILLGAQYRLQEVNPLDYCLSALNVNIEVVPKESNEFGILEHYISNSNSSNGKISSIFKIQRKGEAENIQKWNSVPNHFLLFHGSKVFNFIGILNSGLKIAPPEAPTTGYLFGKGVYFADMFSKSFGYCDTTECDEISQGKKKTHSYLLLCEVALGKMFEVGNYNEFDQELSFLKNGFNSVKALSLRGPNEEHKFVMNNGVTLPLGKIISYEDRYKKDKSLYCVSMPEYIAYDVSQIRMRYLLQIEEEMK